MKSFYNAEQFQSNLEKLVDVEAVKNYFESAVGVLKMGL